MRPANFIIKQRLIVKGTVFRVICKNNTELITEPPLINNYILSKAQFRTAKNPC